MDTPPPSIECPGVVTADGHGPPSACVCKKGPIFVIVFELARDSEP
jgi:hypothetical protein